MQLPEISRQQAIVICMLVLIALVAAALGGWAGAGHIHRVHDQRTYPKL